MDPKRMLDGTATEVELEVLRSADRDKMSSESRQAILGALGILVPPPLFGDGVSGDIGSSANVGSSSAEIGSGSAEIGSTATNTATQGALAGTLSKSLLGLVGAGVVGAASIWGYSEFAGSEAPAAHVNTVPASAAAIADIPGEDTTLETAESASLAHRAEPPAASVVPRPEVEAPAARRAAPAQLKDSLSREFALIESAQAALNRGDGASTLRRLDEYREQFPKGKLRAEATMLRIEGLVATGQRASAARLGRSVLDASPNGPYSRRIRSLLGDLDGDDEPTP